MIDQSSVDTTHIQVQRVGPSAHTYVCVAYGLCFIGEFQQDATSEVACEDVPQA